MRFVLNVWHVYQPGVKYGDIKDGQRQANARWFVPGRFAKIHPARVCSCEMCKGDRSQRRRDRRDARQQIRRDPEHAA